MWGGAIYSNQTAVLAFAGVVAAVGWWYAERRYAELQARLERPRRGVSFAPEARTPRAVGDGGGGGGGAPPPSGPIRIYLDGCFDMLHYGHANALRQAKASGHVLVVGLVNDEEIVVNKGTPPVMCEEERYAALAACKFVDEVIRNAPYNLHKDWVDKLVSEHRITYIVHGDDPCFTADGQDAYAYAKQIGVYKQVKRTEGVSTTDIVGRMLLMTKEHHVPPAADDEEKSSGRMSPTGSLRSSSLAANEEGSGGGGSLKRGGSQELLSASLPGAGVDSEDEELAAVAAAGGSAAQEARDAAARRLQRARMDAIRAALPSNHSRFLPTARRISQFADGRVPGPEDTVVYMPGSWDLFNCGHVAALAAARKLGTFLLVGVYDDPTINKLRGSGRPILNLYERALSLLSCKYVDEVIIGAPWIISVDLITTMNVKTVVRGVTCDLTDAQGHQKLGLEYDAQTSSDAREEAYAVPAKMGILKTLPSPRCLTALDIVARILSQRDMFQARYEKKSKSEDAYVKGKSYVAEV